MKIKPFIIVTLFLALTGIDSLAIPASSRTFTDSGQNLGSLKSEGVALGDIDGDGGPDAFVANASPNKVWLNEYPKPSNIIIGSGGGGGDEGCFIATAAYGSDMEHHVTILTRFSPKETKTEKGVTVAHVYSPRS